MANVTRKIGLSLGADIWWPICYEELLRRLDPVIPSDGDKLRFEVEYLSRWLPKALSEEEVAGFVDAAVLELGATDLKTMGQVMGYLMKRHAGLDGTMVSRLVRTRLSPETKD